ncbi:MAG: hypothetical protein KDI52_07020 [Xanthomonadales bacterium]|nr:hypothetical protein [Xanthomonadales bacterium]
MTINYFENEILSKLTDSGWSLSNKFGSDVDYYTNEFKSDEIWHLQSKTINRGFHLFLHFYNYVSYSSGEGLQWEVSVAKDRYDQNSSIENELCFLPLLKGGKRFSQHLLHFIWQLNKIRIGEIQSPCCENYNSIAILFNKYPEKWGTRGNALVWDDIEKVLSQYPLPKYWEEVEKR